MAKNDSRLLSGRVKTKSGTSLDTRRSDFLSLDNAEPNLGNPDSDRYVLASLADGTRLFLNLNNGFIVNADSVSGDETTFSIDPSGLANADGTTLSEVLDDLDASITLALNSLDSSSIKSLFSAEGNISYNSSLGRFSTPASGVVSGTYGAANKIPVISVDSFGQVDSIGLVTPTTSLGDTVDSMSFNNITGIITLTTDVASFPVQLGLAPFDTDSLSEGSSNLYYTTDRVDSDILSKVDSDYVRARADSDYIKSVTGIDADTLDGLQSIQFLRSDQDDSMAGTLFIDDSLSANNITRRNTTVIAGTYGSGSAIPVITVDGSGFVDSAGTITVATVLNTIAETGTGSINLLDSSLEIAAGVGIDTIASGNTVTVEIDSADLYAYFNHDDFFGFVANEHIDHSSVNINAGKGLTGGGNIASDVTIDIDSANVRAMFSGGTGITYNNGTGAFTTTDGDIVHDNLSGFVLNEHIDHSSVSITAGAGLTGGGTIASDRTLNVVGGDGITANADEIEVTVDGSTIELSATDGSGAVRVKDGGITNTKLENSSLTVGSTNIALGATSTTLAGLTQLDIDNIRIDGNTISSTSSGNMFIDPHPEDSAGTLVILGDLQINGTTTTINSVNLSISDKNIVLADSAINAAQATGAGITVGTYASNPTITYDGATDRWDFNRSIEVTGDIVMPDNSKIKMGTGADLQILHNGTNSQINNYVGALQIIQRKDDNDVIIYSDDGAGDITEYVRADGSTGETILSHYGTNKLSTKVDGIEVAGDITVNGDITFSDSDNIVMPDNSKIKMGTGADLEIYHDGSHSYVDDRGTGDLRLRGNGSVKIMQYNNSEQMAAFKVNGAVELYHDNVKKFETSSTGVDVTGSITTDSATINGDLTVDTDTLFVDAANNRVGIGTASPAATLDVNGHMAIDTDSGQTSSISQTSIATFTAATFSGAKLVVTAKDESNRYISELLITHNGTTAVATEYGQVATSSALATYDVDINGGNVRLLATPVSTNPTTFKVMKLLLID